MKWLLVTMLLFIASAEAQIFRCETQQGLVFSDTPCSAEAEIVDVESDSSGITAGTSDEVLAQLAQKKEQRALEREQARKLKASQQPVYMPAPVEQTVIYPGIWPYRPSYRPYPRPPRQQPNPGQGGRPPMLLPESGGSLLQIPKR